MQTVATPKISVVTPTIRPDGLALPAQALSRQTLTQFEWLVGAAFRPPELEQVSNSVWVHDSFTDGFYSLNRIYNQLFAQSRGELIVTLQDNISIPPDGLQKFWDAYLATDKTACISGVGDQYEEVNKFGKPLVKIWSDPRKTTQHGSFYECHWNDCEWNWAAIPKRLYDLIGGTDEQLDFVGYDGGQLQVCERLHDAGILFYLDQDNESFTLRHSRDDFGGTEAWNEQHVVLTGRYAKRKAELQARGQWPHLHSDNSSVSNKGKEVK